MVKCNAEMRAPSPNATWSGEAAPLCLPLGYLFPTWQGGMEEKTPQTDLKSWGLGRRSL